MNELLDQINRYQVLYSKLVAKASKELRKLPHERLRLDLSDNRPAFYKLEANGKLTYLKKENEELIHALVKKRYLEKAIRCLDLYLQKLKRAEKTLQTFCPDRIFSLAEEIKSKTGCDFEPLLQSDEEFAEIWAETDYQRNPSFPEERFFLTNKEETVRSKSEKIIADFLFEQNIPYRYEERLDFSDAHVAYPDFSVLNKRTRQVIYWEHFGMMDNPTYFEKMQEKIALYTRNGYILGKNLFVSFESSYQPFDISLVKKTVLEMIK